MVLKHSIRKFTAMLGADPYWWQSGGQRMRTLSPKCDSLGPTDLMPLVERLAQAGDEVTVQGREGHEDAIEGEAMSLVISVAEVDGRRLRLVRVRPTTHD